MSSWFNLILSKAPKLYYRMNETTGHVTTIDSSGHGYTGANVAAVQVDGALGSDADKARSYNGTTAKTQITAGFVFPAGSPITIMFWVQIGSADIHNCSAFTLGDLDVPQRCQAHFWSDQNIYWDYGDIPSGGRVIAPYLLDVWQLVTLRSSGAANTYRSVQVNNSPPVAFNSSSAPTVDLTGGFVGTWPTAGFLKGQIDEFIVLDRVLSDAEVLEIYAAAFMLKAFADSNNGSDNDIISVLKATNILNFSDSNASHENFSFGDGSDTLSDSNKGIATPCITVNRSLHFADWNVGHNLISKTEHWDTPHSPPPLTGIGGYIPQAQTSQIILSESNIGKNVVAVKKNGVLVGGLGCH